MKSLSIRLLTIIGLITLALPLTARPFQNRGPDGIFEGPISFGTVKLRVVFNISKAPDGTYGGTVDSPDQGATGIKISSITVNDKKIVVELKSIAASFEGTLNAEGSEISGAWKQGGQDVPLVVKRVEKATETARPQEPKKPYPYDEEELAFENKAAGVKLAGTLTLPRSSGPFPAAILITGSGPQDRNEALLGHKPFLVLADHLTRKGIAVLRYDDRGVGKSTGNFQAATTEDFASDVLAAIEYLKARKEINPKKLGLIGHSEGGIIAPMVAAKSADVAFIVLMAGTAVTGEEVLYLQGELISRVSGASERAVAAQRSLQETLFRILKQEKDDAAAEKRLHEETSKLLASMSEELRKETGVSEAGMEQQLKRTVGPWFRFFLTYDPATALGQVKCPVLALNGERDLQVVPRQNLPEIAKALEKGGNTDYTIVKLPKLNHLFQTSATGAVSEYLKIEETIAPLALEIISDWIIKRVG